MRNIVSQIGVENLKIKTFDSEFDAKLAAGKKERERKEKVAEEWFNNLAPEEREHISIIYEMIEEGNVKGLKQG